MKLSIRITRTTIVFTAPDGVVEGQVKCEQYNMKPGVSVAASLRAAMGECSLPQARMDDRQYALHLRQLGCDGVAVAMDAVQERKARSVYSHVVVTVDTPLLFVPQEEFDEGSVATLYAHAYTNFAPEESIVLTTLMPELGVVAAYSVGRDLDFVLGESFRNVCYMPMVVGVLSRLRMLSHGGFQEKLFCHFHDKRVDVCAFRKNRLRFCSSFELVNTQDSVYYILNVWQQLAMRTGDILCLSGSVSGYEAIARELGRFIKNVKRIEVG